MDILTASLLVAGVTGIASIVLMRHIRLGEETCDEFHSENQLLRMKPVGSDTTNFGRLFPLVTRRWIYLASKDLEVKGGGGTKELQGSNYESLIPSAFSLTKDELPDNSFRCEVGRNFESKYPLWCSGTSFGELGAMAVRALSDGTAILGTGAICNTGDGGLSIHHVPVNLEGERYRKALNDRVSKSGGKYKFRFDRTVSSDGRSVNIPLDLCRFSIDNVGDLKPNPNWDRVGTSEMPRNLIIQIGPSLSGFKDDSGNLDTRWLNFVCSLSFVKGVEVKLHDGANPNSGETIFGRNITDEVAALRGIESGKDYSPPERLPFIPNNSLDNQVRSLKFFLKTLRNIQSISERELLVGVKVTYCGGGLAHHISKMIIDGNGPDYIQVDGGGGGTVDYGMVGSVGYSAVHCVKEYNRTLSKAGVRDRVTLVASGGLVEPGIAAIAMCSGADIISSRRGPLMSLGCIQNEECYLGMCKSGIATHNYRSLKKFDPILKSVRYANYVKRYRESLIRLARISGVNLLNGERFSKKNIWVYR